MKNRETIVREALDARSQAEALVRLLSQSKASSEIAGTSDLFRRVTGQSGLDIALATARRTVESYDRVLAELGESSTTEFMVHVPGRASASSPWTVAAGYAGRPA